MLAPMSEPMTLTLPEDLAERLRARQRHGDYATLADVIRDGLDALEEAQSGDLEHWLRTEAQAEYAAIQADPSLTVSHEEAFARVRAHIAEKTRGG